MKNRLLMAVIAVTLLCAPAAFGIGLDTSGIPGPPAPPPPPIVNCTITDNNVTVTSFADILGYQLKGPCTVSFPGTNIKPVTSSYEGGGSWTAATGAVNEFIKGRDAKGQEWEVRGSANCHLDPWMTGVAAAGCNGTIASATPNAPHNVFKTMKVPVTASILDQSARTVLTVKALQAMKLEHNAPGIFKPSQQSNVTFPSNLEIAPYLDSPAKTYAVEWQALVNNVWTPQHVFDQAGLKTPLPADKFGASQVWQVRARQHQSTKASWSEWVMFFVPATLKVPIVVLGCNNTAAYGATYDITGMPATLKVGTTTKVSIKVTNGSNQTWGAGSSGSNYHLSYHWAQNGAIVVNDGEATFLASALAPCQSVVLSATVKAPPAAGTWTIEWDMVNEGVAWFSTQGVATGNKTVTVTP